MDIKIVRSESGDWVGLYVDNELCLEGHSLPLHFVIEAITKKKPTEIEKDDKFFNEHGGKLPDVWEEGM